jgi:hypothetical protein
VVGNLSCQSQVWIKEHFPIQRLDVLEREAEEKGGVQQMLADHFAKVYKVNLPVAA